MKVEKYILEKDISDDGIEKVSLARIVIYDDIGQQGEEYFDGKWHPFDGALSYIPDPSPGEFINEEHAMEIMKQIDREDLGSGD